MRNPARCRTSGFSLVELLVALVFTGLLMSGMAKVFETSLSSFMTASEGLSSARRNRLAIDLMEDDLNAAGMYLQNLIDPPTISATNPAFFIIPNQSVKNDAGAAVAAGGTLPTLTDELYMYMDSALPMEGTLATRIPGMDEFVGVNGGAQPAAALSFKVSFTDPAIAKQVKAGQFVILKDWFKSKLITTAALQANGTDVLITPDPIPNTTVSNCGASYYDKFQHIVGAPVVVVQRGRMVRYRIKAKAIDPNGGLVPCLVREEVDYNVGADASTATAQFPVATTDQILAEDVSSMKVYLSGDAGATWSGEALATTVNTFTTGWTNGIFANLLTKLPNGTAYTTDQQWFRQIPALVRIDLKTRTPMVRREYLQDGQVYVTTGYRDRLQTFVTMPRHFGLPLRVIQ